ncbi:MAG TPA: M20 family metallo-hydrolase [Chthoniobacterales bacterium]|nr:M20 family metallo-hydrolase [Chthoniobacterales bacterium]
MLDIAFERHTSRIQRRLDQLATVTDEKGTITRTFLSSGMEHANHLVAGWMREAGLETSEDSVGNLLGRNPSSAGPIFLLGSHLDTVRNAGRFDGALGVILGIEAVEILRSARVTLPFSLAVAGFADEEGVRFQNAYIGSKAFCGLLTSQDLVKVDREGQTMLEVIEQWCGHKFSLPGPKFRRDELAGYLEVHMEQGPVLESEGLALGVVSAIAGQLRCLLTWTGKASHAGTTPVGLRRDALAGAAEFIRSLDKASDKFPGLMASVGRLTVEPNVSNVVPARVIHTLDARHQSDSVLDEAGKWIERRANEIAKFLRLDFRWEVFLAAQARNCDELLSRRLLDAVTKVTGTSRILPSGAGHDAAILSPLYPAAVLFVRCRDGLSHHPDEFVSEEDIGMALQATIEFLRSWEGP